MGKPTPKFLIGEVMIRGVEVRKKVEELAKPIIEKKGLVLLDVESEIRGKDFILRLFLHKIGGRVNLGECEQISREVELKLDNDLNLDLPYILEVSTPGIFRKLKSFKEFSYFEGLRVQIIWRDDNGKESVLYGIIQSSTEQSVTLDIGEKGIFTIFFNKIISAKLEPELEI